MDENKTTTAPAKWLRYLFYVHLAGVAFGLFSSTVSAWLSLAMIACETICLYQLIPLGARYKKAATFYAGLLACTLLTRLGVGGGILLTLAATILGMIGSWQEYHGHSQLVADQDGKLSKNWHNLFFWEIAVSVISSVLTVAATMILIVGEIDTAAITVIVTMLMTGVSAVLGILYLVYLNKTAKLLGA